jgi:hypothetical protein
VNVEPFEALVRDWRAKAQEVLEIKTLDEFQDDRAALVHRRLIMCAEDLENAIRLATAAE